LRDIKIYFYGLTTVSRTEVYFRSCRWMIMFSNICMYVKLSKEEKILFCGLTFVSGTQEYYLINNVILKYEMYQFATKRLSAKMCNS